MRRDLVEGGSGDVDPAHDEVGADVALVPGHKKFVTKMESREIVAIQLEST